MVYVRRWRKARIVLCVIVWRILASVRERKDEKDEERRCEQLCGFEKWREKVEPATSIGKRSAYFYFWPLRHLTHDRPVLNI
jgi:hypothetical protein